MVYKYEIPQYISEVEVGDLVHISGEGSKVMVLTIIKVDVRESVMWFNGVPSDDLV